MPIAGGVRQDLPREVRARRGMDAVELGEGDPFALARAVAVGLVELDDFSVMAGAFPGVHGVVEAAGQGSEPRLGEAVEQAGLLTRLRALHHPATPQA